MAAKPITWQRQVKEGGTTEERKKKFGGRVEKHAEVINYEFFTDSTCERKVNDLPIIVGSVNLQFGIGR